MSITIQPEKHEKLVPLNVRIPEKLDARLEQFCSELSSSKGYIVAQILQQVLDDEDRKMKRSGGTKKHTRTVSAVA